MMSNLDLGIAAFESSNFAEAFELLLPLAQTENLEAQKMIAYMYGVGQGVKMDISQAVKWYLPSAKQGDVIAQNNLATFLLHQNPEEAIKWLLAAAEQNFPFAQEVLGDIYSGQLNLSTNIEKKYKDYTKAFHWYSKAAKKGFPISCHRLGEMYANGQGVIKDNQKALEYYQLAASMGYEPSREAIEAAEQAGNPLGFSLPDGTRVQ